MSEQNAGNGELKPCPFCGSKPVHADGMGEHWVRCTNDDCICSTKMMPTKRGATAIWNTRAPSVGAGEYVRLEDALEASIVAIDDWLNLYAPEECDPERVAEAKERTSRYGVLAYIAAVQAQNRAALTSRPAAAAEDDYERIADKLDGLYESDPDAKANLARTLALSPSSAHPAQGLVKALEAIRAMSRDAYCDFISQMQKTPCLGHEAKMASGKFGPTEMEAHNAAHEDLGRHRAYTNAANIIDAALSAQGKVNNDA